MAKNLYEACVEAKLEIDHHESNLYIKDCPVARALVYQYAYKLKLFSEGWLDVPFAYQPFWDAKTKVANG